MVNLEKVAEVLEKIADYLDNETLQKKEAESKRVGDLVDQFTSSYEQLTGTQLPSDVRAKLASTPDILPAITKLAEARTPAPAGPLGGPVEDAELRSTGQVKEAADDADKKFENWVLS